MYLLEEFMLLGKLQELALEQLVVYMLQLMHL